MSRGLADVDRSALSTEAVRVFDEIAWPIAVEDLTPPQLAARYGLATSDVADALDFLSCEIEAQLGGASLPDLDEAVYEALRDDIAERGQLYPIIVARNGKVIDGANRMRACKELGLDPITREVDVADDHQTSLALHLTRRHLTAAQKRHIIRVELLRDDSRSDRELGRLIGIDHKTVGAARAQLEQTKFTLRNFHAPAAGDEQAVHTTPAKPKKVSVAEDLYRALVDVAREAAAYYGQHEVEHRSPELEGAFSRYSELAGDEALEQKATAGA